MSAILSESPSGMKRPLPLDDPRPPPRRSVSPWGDRLFALAARSAAFLTLALLAGIVVSLLIGAMPAISAFGLGFFHDFFAPVGRNHDHRGNVWQIAAPP